VVDDLLKKRWDKVSDAGKHKPIDALKVSMTQVEEKGWTHVIVLLAKVEEDGSVVWHYNQAGVMNSAEQVGLIALAQRSFTDPS
jgi:hypothetical protein